MKILLTLTLLIPLICRAEIELNCETLADYYVEYAKPKNAPSKDMLSSGYYMGLVWGFLNGDSRRSYRPPKDVTMSQASHAVGDWLTNNPQHWDKPHAWCVHFALKERNGRTKREASASVEDDVNQSPTA